MRPACRHGSTTALGRLETAGRRQANGGNRRNLAVRHETAKVGNPPPLRALASIDRDDSPCPEAVIPVGIDLSAPSRNALPGQGQRGLAAGRYPAYPNMQFADVQSLKDGAHYAASVCRDVAGPLALVDCNNYYRISLRGHVAGNLPRPVAGDGPDRAGDQRVCRRTVAQNPPPAVADDFVSSIVEKSDAVRL